MNAREQAREAAIHYPGTILSVSERTDLRAGADAASDIWEPIVRELVETIDEMINTGAFMHERARRLTEIKEALG